MRATRSYEKTPGDFGKPDTISNFTFEQKIDHIKAARDRKILEMQQGGVEFGPGEKEAVTLTVDEYDKYRDPQNSLTSASVARQHTWNYALEMAGIPIKKRHGEYSPADIRKAVKSFFEDFKTHNSRYPTISEYKNSVKKLQLPSIVAITGITGQTFADYLMGLGLKEIRNSSLANQPYKKKDI